MRYLAAIGLVFMSLNAAVADEKVLQITGRYRQGEEVLERKLEWEAGKTAVIICDMWDQHWCASATRRCGEIAPRINEMVNRVRSQGGLIVHAPSDTMKTYEGTAGRKLAMSAPAAPSANPIGKWRYLQPEKEGKLPIDDSDGGCDDEPQCRNYRAWKGEHPAIKIVEGDAISDSGQEIYNLLKQRGIQHLIMCGVHTNMCVLGRSFGIREMVSDGFDVVLVRDLTDTMYNPRKAPFVPHARGTDLVIAHVERNWCPSILSSDILGDKKPLHVVMALDEPEYHAKETMPEFAKSELEPLGLKVTILKSEDVKDLPGTEAIASADVLLIFMRRTTLPPEQFNRFKAHFDAGKAVMAVRTGSHAFQNWLEIDKKVLGVTYGMHYSNKAEIDVSPNPKMLEHPILRGVTPLEFHSVASLYKLNPLMETATPLLFGKSKDNPVEPVVVINTYNGGRAFYLALGHPEDFKIPQFRKLLSNGILWALDRPIAKVEKAAGAGATPELPEAVKSAKGLDSVVETLHAPMRNTAALSAEEEGKKFKLAGGLAVDLIAAEPVVRQPLNISFDERGRMWVVQYIQYPFPAGLKVVEYDRYIRAKFDKTPLPPPNHFPGHDRITIHEDVNGDGTFSKVTTFVDGLNIATSVLHGRGGVWVMNPPYLLFYPDANRDDVPDGDPVVHLAGFGLEDTHAVASSLMWGPDGWIYGAQGSTCVANIRAPLSKEPQKVTKFLGQAIWRYQPEEHRFEIFAEGGGNTFGVEFDDEGNLFSGTNWGQYRGVHYVQGGYYVKGWGKHGPLTNPYAFGFFGHMPHVGNADRLTHTFVVYGGGLLGKEYEGKIIGPNPLMSRISVTRLEREGSTFKTIEEPPMMSSEDGWFRPVDLKTGPDGAIYIADFYEKRISHVDPRDTWDRGNGRIWRIRPSEFKPGLKSFDMGKMSGDELVDRLSDKNRWVRGTALRVLGDRQDAAVAPRLRKLLSNTLGQLPLEGFWALNAVHQVTDGDRERALARSEPAVRRWAIRLLGDDENALSPRRTEMLLRSVGMEGNPQVRSQLASSLKRLNGSASCIVLKDMIFQRSSIETDASDPTIPLLLWWALESKMNSDRDAVLAMFKDYWDNQIVRRTILPRLARRLASESTPENQTALLVLLHQARSEESRKILIDGIAEAFKGRSLESLTPELSEALRKWGGQELALRAGDKKAMGAALEVVRNDDAKLKGQRVELIQILGQVGKPEAVEVLLEVASSSQWHSVRRSALNALTHFEDAGIGKQIVQIYPKLPVDQGVKAAAISTLTSREAWAGELVKAVKSGVIAKNDVTAEHIERIRQLESPALTALADATFGAGKASSEEKQKEMDRVAGVLKSGSGDAAAGKAIFMARCGTCHTLFGDGGKTGPDLTGYERKNLDFLLLSIVDPSAYVREEYTNFRIKTNDGQTLFGLISERGAMQITLTDSSLEKTVIPKSRIKDERALRTSIMPEELLNGLGERELRELFAYVSAARAP